MNTKTSEETDSLFNFWWEWFLQVDEKNRYTFQFSSKNCARAGWMAATKQERLKISQLEKQNEIMKTALEYYAGPWGNDWGFGDVLNSLITNKLIETGDKAREALQALEEK